VTRSQALFEQGLAAMEAAAAERRVEMAESESRVARLKLALEYERTGREQEAQRIYAEVRAEQKVEC
jgi:hypothetical protein